MRHGSAWLGGVGGRNVQRGCSDPVENLNLNDGQWGAPAEIVAVQQNGQLWKAKTGAVVGVGGGREPLLVTVEGSLGNVFGGRPWASALDQLWSPGYGHVTTPAKLVLSESWGGRGTHREGSPVLPKCPPQLGLAQAEAKSQKLSLSFQREWQEPSLLSYTCCPPGCLRLQGVKRRTPSG